MSNIRYKSKGFSKYYSVNRNKWEEFYDSERRVLDYVFDKSVSSPSIIDVGCGCGGLGVALSNRYSLSFYKGIDINEENIKYAKNNIINISCQSEFCLEDIVDLKDSRKYNIAISFSCVDFNIDVDKMIEKTWDLVEEEGWFIMSARLTNLEGISNINESYQPIGEGNDEVANYVVFNYSDLIKRVSSLNRVTEIHCYGYWGKPSETAVTRYERLCFSVLAIKKGVNKTDSRVILDVPTDLFF